MNRSLVLGVALSALLFNTSCDSTVWLDTTLPSLTGVYTSGACQTGPQELDVSVVLVNQGSNTTLNILPTTKVAKVKSKTIIELMQSKPSEFSSSDFELLKPQEMEDLESLMQLPASDDGVAYIEGEDGSLMGDLFPLAAETINLEYRWSSRVLDQIQSENVAQLDANTGDSERLASKTAGELSNVFKDRTPLLILILDQSNSVLGLGRSSQQYGSDIGHQRLTFFSTLINNLDDSFEIAMLWFSGTSSTFGTDRSEVSRPVKSRDLIVSELNQLNQSMNFKERTPLLQALTDTKSLIESLSDDRYDPVVVVFTDGTESGDSSMGALSHEELTTFFVDRHIPVHTVQLRAKIDPANDPADEGERPKPMLKMSELACLTGGDFFYLRDADQFTYNDTLEPVLRNRLTGRWSLKVRSSDLASKSMSLGAPGFMLGTDFRVTLAKQTRTYNARRFSKSTTDQNREIIVDKRLWVTSKPE